MRESDASTSARALAPAAILACEPAGGRGAEAPELSVVIPLYNEQDNVSPLLEELLGALGRLGRSFEVLCIDDGSRDGTFAELSRLAAREPRLRVIRFRRNFGQTAAMSAGIEAARGVVIGWRKIRKDTESGRKLPSRVANRLISAMAGVPLHDYGCSLKAYRRSVMQGVRLYGEMHRFIPVYASWQGARVAEIVVNHRARRAGASKYGLGRMFKVVLDLMVVKFLASYATKPIYVFGGFGLLSWLGAAVAFGAALYFKLRGLKDFVQTPLPLMAVMLALVGALSLLMGLLGELLIRTYYESQGKRPYLVAEELNA